MNIREMRGALKHLGVHSSPSKMQITYLTKEIDPIVERLTDMDRVDTILFDMDGVAADWRAAARPFAASYLGVEPEEGENFDWLNKHEMCDPCCRAMYSITPSIFSTLPKIKNFDALFSGVLAQIGAVEILTGRRPQIGWLSAIDMRHPDVGQVINDKRFWIEHAVDMRFGVQTVDNARFCFSSERKGDFARPNVLLIEDYDKNRDRFVAAGGKCVLLDSEDGDYNVDKAIEEIALHL